LLGVLLGALLGALPETANPRPVRPPSPLHVNNGDAIMPVLIAGTGLGILPEFILREALAAGRLKRLLPE